MSELLSERCKSILHTVISEYIFTGNPVGSRTISRKLNADLSPASIRNVMVDLEEMGFLSQPHTSAGRVPTNEGLRYYVDCILEVRKLSKEEKISIEKRYSPSDYEIIDIMEETSRLLSKFSRYTGIVLAPRFDNIIFEHIELIKLRKDRILTVFVSKEGMIRNKVIRIEEGLSQEDLHKLSKYLNEILRDLSLRDARKKIVNEVKRDRIMYNQLLSKALELSQKALDTDREAGLYINGKCNMFEWPEFCHMEKMKTIFQAFEEKSVLIELLDQVMEEEGIQIFIGTENQFQEMQECSIVVSPYTWKDCVMGTLGVIGPIRMNYCEVVPIVDYTARTVSRIMDSWY